MTADDKPLVDIVAEGFCAQRDVLKTSLREGAGMQATRDLDCMEQRGVWDRPDAQALARRVVDKLLAELEAQGRLLPA